MNKMKMAHEMALAIQGTKLLHDMELVSAMAWKYADAMQAEADKREDKTRPEVLEQWQPDWSQAPDGLVKYFAVDENGRGGWFISKPTLCHDHWYWSDFEERFGNDCYDNAPSFNYQGNWQDSLRKRPDPKCEVDWSQAPNDAIGWMIFDGASTWLGAAGYLIENAPSFGFTGTHIMERPQ